MKNYSFDGTKLPSIANEGHWRLDLLFYHKNEQFLGMRAYCQITKQTLGFGR